MNKLFYMDKDLKIAIVVGIFTLLGAIVGAIIPIGYSAYLPSEATKLVDKGVEHNNLGEYDEAIKCYDRAIDLDPSFEVARKNKGDAYIHLGKYEDAVPAYNSAIKLNPQYAEAWYSKDDVLNLLGRDVEANTAFAKAKELGYNGVFHMITRRFLGSNDMATGVSSFCHAIPQPSHDL